ncbi:polysaccharide deacetylase family protein [Chondromyces apiculatus]|uniref:Chitooligosaccharide deacetylase n=1 Tax=Chondromyces apiculatus DSM 436 TaxID=1192034 RepID=A0A017T664_9BACT|nr:polysaccharide deacetylase family protein [Chondromyces apiculatus]EYF04041.1 chitooligosaccharide deacetylase [Chondromyces apiculatus DSM 436]
MTVGRALLYAASAGAIALAARSVIVGPIPLVVAAVTVAVYLGLILCGVFILRLGMFVEVLSRGPADARGVALTFDDGPSPEHTPRVLALLDAAGVKATFFVIGRKAEAHPDLVREIVARGHAVGVHGYAHDRLFSLRPARVIEADLGKAVEVLTEITGARPTLMRPPVGHTSPPMARVIEALDLEVVGWSVRGFDGLGGAKAAQVAARIIPGLGDGAIVLLHDAAERDDHVPASIEALPRILDAMRAKDLDGVRVDHWLAEG